MGVKGEVGRTAFCGQAAPSKGNSYIVETMGLPKAAYALLSTIQRVSPPLQPPRKAPGGILREERAAVPPQERPQNQPRSSCSTSVANQLAPIGRTSSLKS